MTREKRGERKIFEGKFAAICKATSGLFRKSSFLSFFYLAFKTLSSMSKSHSQGQQTASKLYKAPKKRGLMQYSYSQIILRGDLGTIACDAICLSGYEICKKKNTNSQYMMGERLFVSETAEKKLSLAVYKLHIMNEMRALLDAHFCMLTISSFLSYSSCSC